MPDPLVIFVDVDDTLVRNAGAKRIPMLAAIEHVKELAAAGAELYCWSSGGADYARAVAAEFGLAERFRAFLPKPHVMLDDQPPSQWRRLVVVHPAECVGKSIADYERALLERQSRTTP
ncbi:MAG TPA: HAD family hydrolase [Planctomycetia bacterium]|nr:HAD family hydrolase [Planctomycetia bacterium]